jgi:preprotein translocase subunit SecE
LGSGHWRSSPTYGGRGRSGGSRSYIQETREELKKCSWPTWQELKGSTVVIAVSIALFGVFVMVADECTVSGHF